MNRFKVVLGCMVSMISFAVADAMPGTPSEQAAPAMDCSAMPTDIAQFAMQLSSANQKMFCGQFSDAQRATAMQLASQQDAMGKSMMSPDQAVQKVAMDSNMMPASQKIPTGCPVK